MLAAVLAVGCSQSAQAFCIYNKTNQSLKVDQRSNYKHNWSAFHKAIGAYGKACCNWKNKDCNKAGKRHSEIKFSIVSISQPSLKLSQCDPVRAKAGGWVVVQEVHGVYYCTAYYTP